MNIKSGSPGNFDKTPPGQDHTITFIRPERLAGKLVEPQHSG
jgi:hypothetical protein